MIVVFRNMRWFAMRVALIQITQHALSAVAQPTQQLFDIVIFFALTLGHTSGLHNLLFHRIPPICCVLNGKVQLGQLFEQGISYDRQYAIRHHLHWFPLPSHWLLPQLLARSCSRESSARFSSANAVCPALLASVESDIARSRFATCLSHTALGTLKHVAQARALLPRFAG